MSRVAQFARALAGVKGLDGEEEKWMQQRLAPYEEALFRQMSPIDQKHAIGVARRIGDIARRRGIWDGEEIRVLVRAALLHDIGKIAGDIGLFDRVAIVLVKRLAPSLARTLVERGKYDLESGSSKGSWRTGLCRAFYAQAVHAERGAALAELVGVEEAVVRLIRHHHDSHEGDRLLEVLAEADR